MPSDSLTYFAFCGRNEMDEDFYRDMKSKHPKFIPGTQLISGNGNTANNLMVNLPIVKYRTVNAG